LPVRGLQIVNEISEMMVHDRRYQLPPAPPPPKSPPPPKPPQELPPPQSLPEDPLELPPLPLKIDPTTHGNAPAPPPKPPPPQRFEPRPPMPPPREPRRMIIRIIRPIIRKQHKELNPLPVTPIGRAPFVTGVGVAAATPPRRSFMVLMKASIVSEMPCP